MKKFVSIFTVVFLCAVVLMGCNKNEKPEETTIDYSKYSFVNISWTRDAENDAETIRFGADGRFTYYCACGSPVNDSDLCEGYTYDDATKTITLDCIEITDEMVTVIKLVKCDETELHLDFDGDIRIFTR